MAAPTSRARSDRNHSPTEGRPHKAKLGRDHSEDMLFLNVAGLDRSAGVLEIGVPKLKIDAAGRIALSPEVLTHLGVRPGSELDVEMTGNAGLTFRRPRKAPSISEAFGSLGSEDRRVWHGCVSPF